jgi:peptidoglycan/xylan/chitin deacetylase (PgdA/CDA1 family)
MKSLAKKVFQVAPVKNTVILGYHRVREHKVAHAETTATLRCHIDTLLDLGYCFATLRQLVEWHFRPANRTAVLTFDDGYQDFYYIIAPILQAYGIRATVFVVAGYVNTDKVFDWIEAPEVPLDYVMTSEQLRDLCHQGFEIGSHTVNHPDLTTVDDGLLKFELEKSKEMLESTIQQPIVSFCYPRGFYDKRVMRLLQQIGYRTAVVSRFSTGVPHPWKPRNTPFDLARVYPYSDPEGFRRQLSVGYEVFQYLSYTLRGLK